MFVGVVVATTAASYTTILVATYVVADALVVVVVALAPRQSCLPSEEDIVGFHLSSGSFAPSGCIELPFKNINVRRHHFKGLLPESIHTRYVRASDMNYHLWKS